MSFFITLAVILAAVVIFLYVKRENQLQEASVNWRPAEARVTASEVTQEWDKNSGTPKRRYGFSITYLYEVDGKTYTGTRYRFHGGPAFMSRSAAEALRAHYPAGARITIFYDPANPQESVIER